MKDKNTSLPDLNLPRHSLKISDTGKEIFDPFRKTWVRLDPEEWVRQNFLAYLVAEKGYKSGLIAVERELTFNKLKFRFDALVYNSEHVPRMLIEFKSYTIPITQSVFDQVSRYNLITNVPYLLVSNGLEHYACKLDKETKTMNFLKEVPTFLELTK